MRLCAVLMLGLVAWGCGDDSSPDAAVDAAMDAEPADSSTDGESSEDAEPVDSGPAELPAVDIELPAAGPVAGEMGRGSFTLGVATASAQIEDQNEDSDWFLWTQPEPEGLGHDTFVNEAVQGYSRALDDVALLSEMNLDAYRFSPSWSRIEPSRDVIVEEALEGYDDFVEALVAAEIKPMITVHHFSSPLWIDDPRRRDACVTATDTDLCGWTGPGADQVIAELAEHARLLAERYGDRVDEWATVNEPINYLLLAYGLQNFPPGRNLLVTDFDALIDVFRNYVRAHVAMVDAIREADQIDADGDGVAAHVGYTLSVGSWVPARQGRVSDEPDDIAGVERLSYVYHYLFTDSLLDGTYDADVDGTADEEHPEWRDHLDWLGVQYYFRAGVTTRPGLIPNLMVTPCFGGFDLGACLPPQHESKFVPAMGYEYWEPGIYEVLMDFAERWPDLPLVVSESGLATEVGRRRAEHVVRSLEWIWKAREDGADVRGYYHWSLMDNFEWSEGFEPRFGLYRVDRSTYERTATEGATVLGEIAQTRMLTAAQRMELGGLGPMTEER